MGDEVPKYSTIVTVGIYESNCDEFASLQQENLETRRCEERIWFSGKGTGDYRGTLILGEPFLTGC